MFQTFSPDFSRLFAVKAPDVKALVDAQQRNVDAFVKASALFAEGAQAILKRQAEIFEGAFKEAVETTKVTMASKDVEAGLKTQIDYAQTQAQKNVAAVRELTEIATKSSTEAFEVLRKRANESINEINTLVGKAA